MPIISNSGVSISNHQSVDMDFSFAVSHLKGLRWFTMELGRLVVIQKIFGFGWDAAPVSGLQNVQKMLGQ